MNQLSEILGDDLLEEALACCLGDDAAPTASEAYAQNAKVLARRRLEHMARVNPELGFSFGRVLKAAATGGVSELARTRIGRAVATGGASEIARAAGKALKGKPRVQGKVSASVKAKPQARISGAFKAAPSRALPPVRIRCKPCKTDANTAAMVAKKIGPEMARIRKLLDRMALSAKATSEHNKRVRQRKWRKEVIGLLKQVREKRCRA